MPQISEEKMTAYLVSCMDVGDRKYVFSDVAEDSVKKSYTYVPYDKRLLRFAEDQFGTVSDAFILLSVTTLGVADKETIRMFLMALRRTDPNLQIPDFERFPTALGNRLSELRKSGFLFCIEYKTYVSEDDKGSWKVTNMLYTVDQEGQNFCNARLGKRMPYNQWIQAKRMNDLLAWSSAAYCGTCLAYSPNFVAFERGQFKGKDIGSVFLPVELRYRKKDRLSYVAVVSSFLKFDDRSMTKQDFDNRRGALIKLIGNYLGRKSKGELYVVVACESRYDLKDLCNLIAATNVFDDILDHVFFTGEGIMLHAASFKDTLLRMIVKEDHSYTLSAVAPDFMTS